MSGQQYVILAPGDAPEGSLAPIGTPTQILEQLSHFNTMPEREGETIFYGPGIRIEMPPGDPVTQMLLTIVEEEIAWLVIMRLAKSLQWKLFDPTSGRELCP